MENKSGAKVVAVDSYRPGNRITVSVPEDVSKLPPAVSKMLNDMDVDGDGVVSLSELLSMMHRTEDAERENRRLRWMMGLGVTVYLMTLGAFFALSWAASLMLKDSFVRDDGVLRSNDGKAVTVATTLSDEGSLWSLLSVPASDLETLESFSFNSVSNTTIGIEVSDFSVISTTAPAVEGELYYSVTLYTCSGAKLQVNSEEIVYTDPEGRSTVIEERTLTGSRLLRFYASPEPHGSGGGSTFYFRV